MTELQPPKLVERLYRAGYLPVVGNFGCFAVAAMAGTLQGLDGKLWWACFNFFCAGMTFACAILLMLAPLRRRDLSDIEQAQVERMVRAAFGSAVAEARKHGVVPPGPDLFREH